MRATFERLFVAHPRSVDESYLGHACAALRFAFLLFWAASAALVHALVPALCKSTASSIIKKLYEEMAERSRRASA